MGSNQPTKIRGATVADVEAIVAVHLEAAVTGLAGIFPPTAPSPTVASLRPRWLELIADPQSDVLVAETLKIVGCVVVRPEGRVPAGMLLDRLYVHPLCWGLGIGGRLHDTALEIALRRGAETLNLWVLQANTRARDIYERWGWRRVPGWHLANQPATVLDVLYQKGPG